MRRQVMRGGFLLSTYDVQPSTFLRITSSAQKEAQVAGRIVVQAAMTE